MTFFPIEEINAADLNEHHIDYYFKSAYKPLVIRGGAAHFPAVQKWKTDFEYLKSRCGDNFVYVRTETDRAEYRKGQRYKINRMEFGKYLDRITSNDRKARSSYMAVTNIRYRLGSIIGDVPLCDFEASPNHQSDRVRVFRLFANNGHKFKLHSGPHLWIAPRAHYEFCHFDPDDSILCMIDGTKRARIFSPQFLDSMAVNAKGTKGRTIQSQIDFAECCDGTKIKETVFDRFPRFKEENVYGYSAELRAGDILFIPAFWFHQITSVTTSISINYFCGDFDDGKCHFPTRIMRDCFPSMKHWFLNLIEQNRNYKQFLSVLSNLESSIFNTFYKQWHDFLTKEQVERLREEVIEYVMDEKVRRKEDIYYEYGDLRKEDNLPKIHRNHPFIKIRGLLYRDD